MSDRSRDDETKQFRQEYPDAKFLAAIERLDLPTAKDVGDAVGCAKSTAADRLAELEDAGAVEGRSVGQATVWAVSDSRE